MTHARLAALSLARRRELVRRVVTIALIALNLSGVAFYLWWVGHIWLPPEELAAGITPQSGDALVWSVVVLPLWAFFFILDAFWAIYLLVPPARWRSVAVVAALVAVWVLAIAVDLSHN